MEPNFLETLFTVRTTRTYTRFNAREVVVTIDKPITNPITDFMNVIEVLGDRQRYSDNTIVYFNLYDSNNRAVWFSRIDGQPLFLGGVRTRNEQLLLRLFDILLNSSEGIEFNKNAKMIITFVICPFEAGIQLPEGLLDRNRLRK